MTLFYRLNLLLHVIVLVRGTRLSTVITIVVLGHEASNSSHGTVLSKTNYLTTIFYTVVFKRLKRNGLVYTLYLLRLGVNLLFTLLTTSTKTQYQMQGRLLLNIVIAQGTSVLQLLSSKDQTLLIGWDSLLILNLGLDIIDRVRWLNIERDGLTCYIMIIINVDNNVIIVIGNALRDASQTLEHTMRQVDARFHSET